MELERPKAKQKKKKKQQTERELSSSLESLHDTDDLEELRRLCDESQKVDNEVTEAIEVEELEEVIGVEEEVAEEINLAEEEPIQLEASAPSAPVTFTETIEVAHQVNEFIYPDLTQIQEESTEVVINRQMSLMKPFDEEVMEQFYANEEMQQIELFEKEFIDNELKDSDVDHFLYALLKKFSSARFELLNNVKDIESLMKSLEDHYKAIWKIENRIALASGFCSCGKAVGSTHNYKMASFCDKTYQELEQNLKKLQKQVCYNQAKLAHECALYQQQIDQIIAEILNCGKFKHINEKSPITLYERVENPELRVKIGELRLYISILFRFLREVPHDALIEQKVKHWIKLLISLQLRVATWHDHIFILFHILRCKDGFGTFGSCFIQIPVESVEREKSFQHCVAVLSTLLMPIQKRIQFLEENLKDVIPSLDTNKSEKDLWILVESDGEDSSSDDYSTLKENDLVAIFDQIPLDVIFKAITYANANQGDSLEIDMEKFKSGHHIIKSIAFASKLVTILKRGLFNLTDRHRQFAKRLGKLLKDTLFFIRDLVQIYEKSDHPKDPDEYQRIHVEFDELIIRSVWVIYDSKKFSLFQYLADFPYEQITSIESLWKLIYSLHVGELRNIDEEFLYSSLPNEFFMKFNHYDIPMDDLIFLLHAFTKIAITKGKLEHEFLMFVVRELIHIGFVIEATRDFCYTTVKNSINDIANEHPKIIDDIFDIIKFNLHQIGAFNLHLLKALPLHLWRPEQRDFFEKIRVWLLNFDFDSLENITARLLIRSLNWNFDENNNNQLFLPHEFHVAMAHLICEIYMTFVDESKDESKLFGVISRKSTKMENISKWCWTTVSLLRLHQMDIASAEFLRNTRLLVSVPELHELRMIYQGYTENKSFAIYLSILISQLGHSLPQLCHYGFKQLQVLIAENRYLKVIECLELMTPIFVNCQESLFSCENFMNILEVLVRSENEQDKFLKDVKSDVKLTVLNCFAFMIQNQMSLYQKYGWTSPTEIAALWTNCLTRVKNWNKEKGVVHLLDAVCKSAYPYIHCWNAVKEIIRPHAAQISVTKVAKSSGWLGLVMAGERDILVSPFPEHPILSLILLECEHENIEVNTGAWEHLINQLAVETKKSFSTTFKHVLQSRDLTSFPPRSLVMYKLAELICTTSVSEFIFPIICQQFFTLYLARSSLVGVSNEGIQSKMCEVDSELFKRLKNKLQECENHHIEMTKKFNKDDKLHFHTISAQVFRTFLLWMDEAQMNKLLQMNGVVLPPQYEALKLKQIFERNRSHWTEFINLTDLRNFQKLNCEIWLKVRLRPPTNFSRVSLRRSSTEENEEGVDVIVERICDRLKLSRKHPKPPPEFERKPLLMGKIDLSRNTLQLFKSELKKIKNYAQQFSLMTNEHKAVDATYLDCIRFAYKNEPTFKVKSVGCSRGLDDCKSSIQLRFEFNEMKVNEVVRTKLNDNREYKNKIVARELRDVSTKVTDANFCLEVIVQQLLENFSEPSNRSRVLDMCTSLLFEMLQDLNEEIKECPITFEFFSLSIGRLGSFVQRHNTGEGIKMLKIVLKNPNTLNVFAKLFEPATSPPAVFIKLYECLVDFYIKNYEPQLVFLLLSKFDMPTWLEQHEPKLIEVSELIQLIFKGLELYSLENSELLQDILKRHLVHLFLYRFPEHYGEILHTVLQGFAQSRLRPCVLMDIVNSLYQKIGCQRLDADTSSPEVVRDEIRAFAAKQHFLCYDDLHSTTLMLHHHFYGERLCHGLHGIYPKYAVYCDALAILFGTIGHGVISAAIKTFSETTADQLVNDLFACLANMYAPMLVPIFYSKSMKTATRPALWIQQLTTESTVLQPWSNLQTENAEKFIKSFAQCLGYLSDMLPASNNLIGNVFQWYINCFAHTTTPSHVLMPIHKLLVKMPFERLLPTRADMEGYNKILSVYLPECHTFLGNVFLRINWSQWLTLQIETGDVTTLQRLLSIFLMTLVKLSYEPKVRESIRILQLLKESAKYPWMLLEYKDVENVLDWIVMSAEPSIILNIPSEHESIDASLLQLLQTASCMRLTQREAEKYQQSVVVAKRMAYVRSIVRLLKACDAKLHQLISSQKGRQMFSEALATLLNLVQSCVQDRPLEATNLVITITDNVLTQTSSENTLSLFASAIETWQSKCPSGDTIFGSFLDALKLQTYWPRQAYQIMESTLRNYFKQSDARPHTPCWIDASERTATHTQFSMQQLIDQDFYLTLHLLSFKKVIQLTSDKDRMEFLQDLQMKLASKKSSEQTEAGQCLVWLLVICSYAQILPRVGLVRSHLDTIITHLQSNFTQSESWGEGLLNAVGLKKDSETNAKKILVRCFTLAIQILLSKDGDCEKSMSDLNSLLSQKKYSDVKMRGMQAMTLLESSKARMSDDFCDVMAKLIRIFYTADFLASIENLYGW